MTTHAFGALAAKNVELMTTKCGVALAIRSLLQLHMSRFNDDWDGLLPTTKSTTTWCSTTWLVHDNNY